MSLEVTRELFDTLAQEGDLHLRGAGVRIVESEVGDDARFRAGH